MAVVSYEGDVLWLPAAIFRSTCSVDILYFPFDIQICRLKFGSWTYDGWKLDIDFHSDVGAVVSICDDGKHYRGRFVLFCRLKVSINRRGFLPRDAL